MDYKKLVEREDERQAAMAGYRTKLLTQPGVEKHLGDFSEQELPREWHRSRHWTAASSTTDTQRRRVCICVGWHLDRGAQEAEAKSGVGWSPEEGIWWRGAGGRGARTAEQKAVRRQAVRHRGRLPLVPHPRSDGRVQCGPQSARGAREDHPQVKVTRGFNVIGYPSGIIR